MAHHTDPDLLNNVLQLLTDQDNGKAPVYLFSGLAQCSCGRKMYVRTGSPKYVCRKCCDKIPIVDLENIVRDELKGFFTQPERVTRHLDEADKNLT